MKNDNNVIFFMVGLIFGLMFGILLIGFVTSTGDITAVDTDFVNNYCEVIYGDNYLYFDDKVFGVDTNITCYKFASVGEGVV